MDIDKESLLKDIEKEFISNNFKKKTKYDEMAMKRYTKARETIKGANINKKILNDVRFLFSFAYKESNLRTLYRKCYNNTKKKELEERMKKIYFHPNDTSIDVFAKEYFYEYGVQFSSATLKKIDILLHLENKKNYHEDDNKTYSNIYDVNIYGNEEKEIKIGVEEEVKIYNGEKEIKIDDDLVVNEHSEKNKNLKLTYKLCGENKLEVKKKLTLKKYLDFESGKK